jgi:transcriptional regulator with XRE-family HTH domain
MSRKTIPEDQKDRFEFLGRYLRELRFSNGLTQQELSEHVGLHRNSINNAENGKNMTLLNIFKIADYFEINVSELLQIN